MAYEEPDSPTSGNPVSKSAFGDKVRNSIIWLKEQADALLAGRLIMYRQGGSATAWDTSGTTNYTLTGVKTIIQGGTINVHTNNGASQGSGSITYPTAFANVPLTFPQLLTTPSPVNNTFRSMVVQSRTANGCTIYINYSGAQTGAIDDSVEWFAFGDIA